MGNPTLKPKNGIAGLKYWREDLFAGFLVAMISTPFSIGVAVASGAPPITGLTSAIIAGLVLPFLGGSYVTISGPAAGLAPVLYSAMLSLGAGSTAVGYPLLLPIILLAGVFQVILSKLKAARYSAVFPVPVVEGMLASIGLMIMAKQLPTLLGHPFSAHEFWGILAETPQALAVANPTVLGLGVGTLICIVLVGHFSQNTKWLKLLSPQLFAVGVGTAASVWFLKLGPNDLIHLPENPLAHGITWPDFQGLFASPHLWLSALGIAIVLTLIDGIESLATIHAVDKIDPYHRQSDPDKTLFAMGVSNICSSLVGGLTIIPGGIKSTANVMAGGKTQWANFYNACFLLVFLLLFHQQISLLPLVVLSAVLMFTGYKLCKPAVWKNVLNAGEEQFVLFTFTILLTLTTDLMWGILGGVVLGFAINILMLWRIHCQQDHFKESFWIVLRDALKNPVSAKHMGNDRIYHIYFNRPLMCFNYLHVIQALQEIPQDPNLNKVVLHISQKVMMIDHTIMDHLAHWKLRFKAETGVEVELEGLDQMKQLAPSDHATRLMRLEGHEQIAVAI